MNNQSHQNYKIPTSTKVFLYTMCVFGSLLGPIDTYLETGAVNTVSWSIALLTLFVGVVIVTSILYFISRDGKFLGIEIFTRK